MLMLSCLFVLTYATCEPNKQYAQLTWARLVCVCHIKSSHSVSASWARLWWGIIGGRWAHLWRPTSCFLHNLKRQPVIILGFGANRLSIWVADVATHLVYHLRFNNASHSRMTANLGVNRALAVHVRYSSVCSRWLVHEHHLVGVVRHLATSSLM